MLIDNLPSLTDCPGLILRTFLLVSQRGNVRFVLYTGVAPANILFSVSWCSGEGGIEDVEALYKVIKLATHFL